MASDYPFSILKRFFASHRLSIFCNCFTQRSKLRRILRISDQIHPSFISGFKKNHQKLHVKPSMKNIRTCAMIQIKELLWNLIFTENDLSDALQFDTALLVVFISHLFNNELDDTEYGISVFQSFFKQHFSRCLHTCTVKQIVKP